MIASPDDPIFALATPPAPSALAVIRISGSGSLEKLSLLLRGASNPREMKGYTMRRFSIWDSDEIVDDAVVAVYRAPRSYTGEDGAEIYCHGSMPVIRRLLSLLGRAGLRAAGPGEFTQRAFLNGRMDLTRAEAVNEIVNARTDRARALALDRLGGAIEARVREARARLVDIKAALELTIDFPEDAVNDAVDSRGLDEAVDLLAGLARTFRYGRVYQEGSAVAIAGATNSGKSCLFNALLRQDRAIVSEVHGTTRDWLEGTLSIEGIPVRLFDTAGLRASSDPLEGEGIRRTLEVVRGADALIYLVDGAAGMSPADDRFLRSWQGPAQLIRAWNKADLPGLLPAPEGFLVVSAMTGEGLDALASAVAASLLGGPAPNVGEPLIDSERQRDLLQRALQALSRFRDARSDGISPDLLAVDLADALDALGELTGEVTNAEVLDRMFSRFCVGK